MARTLQKEIKEYLQFFVVILVTLIAIAVGLGTLWFATVVTTWGLSVMTTSIIILGCCVFLAAFATLYVFVLRLMVGD